MNERRVFGSNFSLIMIMNSIIVTCYNANRSYAADAVHEMQITFHLMHAAQVNSLHDLNRVQKIFQIQCYSNSNRVRFNDKNR